MTLDTPRLQLVPSAARHFVALMEGPDAFERSFGLPAAEGLGAFAASGDVSPVWLERMRASPGTRSLASRIRDRPSREPVRHRQSRLQGSWRRRWRGRNCVWHRAGVSRTGIRERGARRGRPVRARPRTRPACARSRRCRPINASARVLVRGGFTYIGEVDDPEDGRVLRWELTRAEADEPSPEPPARPDIP